MIQDRMFYTDGSLAYPYDADNPDIHPYWIPEFFGNTIVVNGKVWPYLDVEPRKYHFRFLNGSNARFYSLQLKEQETDMPGPAIYQIGTDGGYLPAPVMLYPNDLNAPKFLIAPGERADVIIDFSGYPVGTQFILKNYGKVPFPNGTPPHPQTMGEIMQFRVVPLTGTDYSIIPETLNTIYPLTPGPVTRTLTLEEVMGPNGPVMALLDGKMWDDPISELPTVGSTEVWQIINLTGDAHPIHLHLVQFQLVSRQKFRIMGKMDDVFAKLGLGSEAPALPPGVQLITPPLPPDPNEAGWKDTFRMNPRQVTTVIVRFAPIGDTAVTPYPFDATAEPGYVWHCHILEHEDNEMMRPYKLVAPPVGGAIAGNLPEGPVLRHNYPNPFNPETEISFELPEASQVELKIFNILGQEVRTLVDQQFKASMHAIQWDGKDARGQTVASGIYLYRLQAGNFTETKKMTLLK